MRGENNIEANISFKVMCTSLPECTQQEKRSAVNVTTLRLDSLTTWCQMPQRLTTKYSSLALVVFSHIWSLYSHSEGLAHITVSQSSSQWLRVSCRASLFTDFYNNNGQNLQVHPKCGGWSVWYSQGLASIFCRWCCAVVFIWNLTCGLQCCSFWQCEVDEIRICTLNSKAMIVSWRGMECTQRSGTSCCLKVQSLSILGSYSQV